MGTSPSRYADLSQNVHMEKFCGKESLSPEDAIWNRFLSYNIRPPLIRTDQIEFDSYLENTGQQLLLNNPLTGNVGSLIQVTLKRINELLAIRDAEM